ncbi:helix-turn-helix domain-containing protein [Ureibacillus sinduriensis]|uniref:DNA-binding protein n=1 Tax=Ureibacillus sinduriensis BLB-1 = JCM 15800 TaxID=1384057 RepID=A0A0A3I391_9BACL|nr:helix-turn-helix domain-containing protein [Ureibacillus sinduriensis]KGR77970.1 DNA-binding protein [Ureibacillus sinduriensis BLB-1 = JCM 15800]
MKETLIGKKIEDIRKNRGFSLRELASKAEITPSMLSQIEKNNANPSIQTLKSLAKVLDVPVFTFLMDEIDTKELIVRKENRTSMTIDGLHYELISPDFTSQIATAIMRLTPGCSSSDELLSHKGEEVAFVLEGSIHLNLMGDEYELNTGDSVKIPSYTKHKWINKNDYEASILFSVTPPSF